MPLRLHPRLKTIPLHSRARRIQLQSFHQRYASAVAYVPAPSIDQVQSPTPHITRYPRTQPPSYKRPEVRKSQLLRQYASLLHSTPLILLFQHNNLKSTEWMSIRREFNAALRKVDEAMGKPHDGLAGGIKIQIIQTGIFAAALKIVEYFDPNQSPSSLQTSPSDPKTQSSASMTNTRDSSHDTQFQHTLSRAAHEAVAKQKVRNGLGPLLSGPLALVTFPSVSPQHLKAAISILAPNAPGFPAPTRRGNPGYHDPVVQNGLQKLMLLGARIEGKIFDTDGTRSVGAIEGGMEGLRAQLVAALQGVSASVTNTLESTGRTLYITVEGRREMLEEPEKSSSKGED